jgi:adenylyltransferase/sulfurtransferase
LKEKNVQELESMLNDNKDFILLDVRTDNEVLISKISEKSYHIPMNDIPSRISELDNNKEVIVYCKSGKIPPFKL